MNYFITGGTGFIGRHVIAELLEKKPRAKIYVLVRSDSKKKFNQQKVHWGDDARRVTAITGDLTRPLLGVPAKKRRELEGEISQVFHLGAVYDLMAEAEHQVRVNFDGTR
ncbi:MAG: SDR family oxidoreductase, partial [Lysobacterales bacterium]